jgi:eukaryotic-like serine/threonine-protein kinase
MIGTTVGSYRVLDKLGEGGMGEVYLADDERLHRRVALKVLPLEFVSDAGRVERFEREVRAVGALNHPNILTLFDLGRFGDQYFMATEFIDGRTLRALMHERGTLPLAEAIGIIVQCAEALACAHAAGIVHRDIKPENLMIRRDGYVKLLDFGLATIVEPFTSTTATTTIDTALTSAGVVLGTVGYLSPEQARGQAVDSRTDIFSLGVVLYEMLTGTRPFRGSTPTDTLIAILQSAPPPLSAFLADPPAPLGTILDTALAKDREARYSTVLEFSQDLERLSRDLAVDAHLRAGSTPAAVAVRPRPARLAIVAVAALAVTISGALWWSSSAPKTPTTSARTESELPAIRTLAVLPFQLLGYPEASEHLGLGMADALIVKLTSLRQLTVRPTTAVLRYQTGDPDVMAVGRALQVDAVLTGNVQRDSGRTRVTVQLIRTAARADASTVWSDAFTTSTNDPFEVQDHLAAQLVEKLALQLTGDEQAKLTARETRNPRARQLSMEGRFFANKRTIAGLTRAVELFEDAVRLDPDYARAHYGRALALNGLIELGALSSTEAVPKVRDGLDRALRLDPTFGEAYGLRSLTSRVYEWRFDQADRESKQSMDLDPNNPTVLQWRGIHLLALGRVEEAVALHARSVEVDPLDMVVRALQCRALYLAKRYDDAIRTGRDLIALDPSQSVAHQWIGLSLVGLGQAKESLASLKQAVTLARTSERLAALAYGYAVAGSAAEAREIITALEAPRTGISNAYHIATVYAGLGDREKALQWLDRALRDRDGFLPNRVKLDPKLDPLREEPRFQRLLEATLRDAP